MRRKIISIDESKCDGCGQCVPACPEGALQIVDGKARLVKESYCDGLGACLGDCPRGAVTLEERDVEPYDSEAAAAHGRHTGHGEGAARGGHVVAATGHSHSAGGGCPGSIARQLTPGAPAEGDDADGSQLVNWPVQIRLAPPTAPYFHNADLLICADCVPFALSGFPWATLGYAQHQNTALLALAPYTGVYGLSFVSVLGGAALARGARDLAARRRPGAQVWLALACVAAVLVAGSAFRAEPEGSLRRSRERWRILFRCANRHC